MRDYVKRLEEKLAAERLSTREIRDGIIESYVVANRKALALGLKDKAIDAEDDDVFEQVYKIMENLFAGRGGNIEDPNARELRSTRHTMDLKLRITELPVEISEMHDMVCEMILQKAEEASVEEGIVAPQPLDAPLEDLRKEVARVAEETFGPSPDGSTRFAARTGFEAVPRPASSKTDTREKFSPFLASLESRLGFDRVSPVDARDGIIESFVVANRRAVEQGAGDFVISKSDGEVELFIRGAMRDFFAEHDSSFDDPSLEVIEMAKTYLDEKLRIHLMPESIRNNHEETCSLLLANAQRLVYEISGKKPLKVVSFTPSPEVLMDTEEHEVPLEAPAASVGAGPLVDEPSREPLEVSAVSEMEEPASVENPIPESPYPPAQPASIEEIIRVLRSELSGLVREEVTRHFESTPKSGSVPQPPSGIAASISGKTLFLAWLDLPDQPGYHVYRKEGERWVRLTAAPLARASFRMQVESEGEALFAVSTVSRDGVESELSPEIKVKI